MPQIDPTPHQLWHHITQISTVGCKMCEAEANSLEYYSNKVDEMELVARLQVIQSMLRVDDSTSNHDIWHKLDVVEEHISKLIDDVIKKGLVGDDDDTFG